MPKWLIKKVFKDWNNSKTSANNEGNLYKLVAGEIHELTSLWKKQSKDKEIRKHICEITKKSNTDRPSKQRNPRKINLAIFLTKKFFFLLYILYLVGNDNFQSGLPKGMIIFCQFSVMNSKIRDFSFLKFSCISQCCPVKNQNMFRCFHCSYKIEISIWVFHSVCQFGFFTSVPIRVFAPYPLYLFFVTVIVKSKFTLIRSNSLILHRTYLVFFDNIPFKFKAFPPELLCL